MSISIDWLTKVISVPKNDLTLTQLTPIEIRELDLNWFRLELKSLEDSEEGIPFLDTHRHNTEVSLGGLTYARVIEIINGYTVTFENGQYAVNLVGANSNVGDVVNVNQVSVRSANSAGLISSPAIEYASFNGGVTIDVIDGVAGTVYNIGTVENPVDNLTDAVLIANTRGFGTLYINKSMILDAGTDIRDFTIIGSSSTNTYIEIDPSAICDNINIKNCNVSGTLDGGTEIHDCKVGNLTYVYGHIHDSGLYGTIILGGNEEAIFVNCYTSDQDSPPIIDMGGSGQDLAMPDYGGIVTIKNLASDTEEVGIGLDAGMVILESTVSAGTIVISGNGILLNYSTGSADVNTDGLMSKQTITEIVWDAIYIDTSNGHSGTAFPIGTHTKQSNNISDAISIADSNGIKTFSLRGSIVLPQTLNDFTFIGAGSLFSDVIDLNGQTTDRCRFEYLTVSGTMLATESQFIRCKIIDVSGLNGLYMDSALQGNIVLGGPGSLVTGQNIGLYGNTPGAPCVIDMVGYGRVLQASVDGAVQFSNLSTGSFVEIGLRAGIIILDPTCTGGNASFTGAGNLINYSATTVMNGLLTESSITDAIWDEQISGHTTSGTFGKLMSDINVSIDAITVKLPAGNIAEYEEYATTLSGIETYILRSLGLVQENHYLDQTTYTTYQGVKLLTGGRIRTYTDTGSVGTSNDVLATYQIISTWTDDELDTYKVARQ